MAGSLASVTHFDACSTQVSEVAQLCQRLLPDQLKECDASLRMLTKEVFRLTSKDVKSKPDEAAEALLLVVD